MLELVATSVIGCSLGFIGAYIAIKTQFKTDKILDILDEITDELTQNVEMQKKVYVLGGILGNGISKGVGLPTKKGKFSFEDLAGQLITGFLQKWSQGQQNDQAPNPIPQNTRGIKKTL